MSSSAAARVLKAIAVTDVASTPDLLKAQSQDEMRGTKLVPNAVQPGTFQDHMKGMQRGATTVPSTLTPPQTVPDARRGLNTPLPGTERPRP